MQPSPQTFCPECGAPAPFRGTAVSLVCEYCNSTIVRSGVDVSLVGKVSAILDTGSPILLNARGKYKGTPFTVDGRLQVRYARGTWNEWFITFADGTVGWLSDAQGSYAIVTPKDVAALAGGVPPFPEMTPGTQLMIDNRPAVVVDARGAHYQGAEGILPFEAEPGMTFYGVDLRGFVGEFFTLDYGHEPQSNHPIPYAGQAVDLKTIELQPLRRFEGWR